MNADIPFCSVPTSNHTDVPFCSAPNQNHTDVPFCFALYDILLKKSASMTTPTHGVLHSLCSRINNLPAENLDVIYALMIHHTLVNNITDVRTLASGKLPYRMEVFPSGKGILIRMKELDPQLRNILAAYIAELQS